jgi:hypothetical protein
MTRSSAGDAFAAIADSSVTISLQDRIVRREYNRTIYVPRRTRLRAIVSGAVCVSLQATVMGIFPLGVIDHQQQKAR